MRLTLTRCSTQKAPRGENPSCSWRHQIRRKEVALAQSPNRAATATIYSHTPAMTSRTQMSVNTTEIGLGLSIRIRIRWAIQVQFQALARAICIISIIQAQLQALQGNLYYPYSYQYIVLSILSISSILSILSI